MTRMEQGREHFAGVRHVPSRRRFPAAPALEVPGVVKVAAAVFAPWGSRQAHVAAVVAVWIPQKVQEVVVHAHSAIQLRFSEPIVNSSTYPNSTLKDHLPTMILWSLIGIPA